MDSGELLVRSSGAWIYNFVCLGCACFQFAVTANFMAMPARLISLLGLITFLLLAWALSSNRKAFPWRTVVAGIALQFVLALLILHTALGHALFAYSQAVVERLNGFAVEGARMVFGPLADAALLGKTFGAENGLVFAVTISATIILIGALSSVLYHWGILQRVVHAMAFVMQRLMRVSGSESLSAAANVFVGQTEAPLVIRPYLPRLTQSELLAVMVGGMATIAGGVMAVYVSLGARSGDLLTASIMSAPAALLVAKIMLPETEQSETSASAPLRLERDSANSIDALCRGASDGMQLVFNMLAMLIAFVAIVALLNHLIGLVSEPLGAKISLQQIFGYINAPFAWLMGVPAKDCLLIGQCLGERIALNEFIGYLTLTRNEGALDERSFRLAVYALCGFANFGSIAIQIGGIGALAPNRRADLARLGVRSMIGGLLACYITASIVGILI